MTETKRIRARFEQLRREKRKGLVTFITAGDPDERTSLEILKGLPDAGADIIELGMPFSDPMADGPTIDLASQRALKAGMSLKKTLDMVRTFRKDDQETPIVLMGYFNPIYSYGVDKFVKDARSSGVDGLIVVDVPPEEDELSIPAVAAGLDVIRLATPTTRGARLAQVLENAGGFVYYVSILGITGTRSADLNAVEDALDRIRKATDLPLAVGFGIKTPDQAAQFAKIADAVVVGSAVVSKIVENLDENGAAKKTCIGATLDFVRRLREGVENVVPAESKN